MHVEHEKQTHELQLRAKMRRAEQAGRIVYVRTSLGHFPSENLSFVEDSITIICPAPHQGTRSTESTVRSVLLHYYGVRAQHQDVFSLPGQDRALDSLMERVINKSSDRIECHMRKLVKKLQAEDDVVVCKVERPKKGCKDDRVRAT